MLRRVAHRARCTILLALAFVALLAHPCSADTDMAQRYLRAAERDDVTAQVYVASLYSTGIGFTQSDRESFRWFLRAAENGHGQAQVIVAGLYAVGRGVTKNNMTAYRWASQASNSNDATVRGGGKQLMDALSGRLAASERNEAAKSSGAAPVTPSSFASQSGSVSQPDRAASLQPSSRESERSIPPVQLQSSDVDGLYRRGIVRAQRGEYAVAIEDFSRVIQLEPNDAQAFNNLCWTRAVVGQLRSALADCNQALRLRPNFADALDSRGLVYLKLGEFDRAINDFSAALRHKPGHAPALYGRGIARQRMGQTAGGIADVASARAHDPNIASKFAGYGVE